VVEEKRQGFTLWLTGMPGAGKTTISTLLERWLQGHGARVERLDGDEVRKHLSKGLGFSREDRDENIRRIGFVARLLSRNGVIAIVAAISPYRSVRQELRLAIEAFRAGVVEAAHPPKGAEMMVEGAVLLHQDDDVFNITNRACAVACRDFERLGDVRLQRTHDRGHAHQLQEITPVGMAHEVPPFYFFRDCAVRGSRPRASATRR